MLGLRSLAANLSLDPEWVLNQTELSRVPWRYGGADGELVVEVDGLDGIDVMDHPGRIQIEPESAMTGKRVSGASPAGPSQT